MAPSRALSSHLLTRLSCPSNTLCALRRPCAASTFSPSIAEFPNALNSRHALSVRHTNHRATLGESPTDVKSPTRRRLFSTSASNYRDHHFDTLKFVQRLKGEGFSEEQSQALMLVLSDVIEESIQNLTRTMVLKEGRQPLSSMPRQQSLIHAVQTQTAQRILKRSTSPNFDQSFLH